MSNVALYIVISCTANGRILSCRCFNAAGCSARLPQGRHVAKRGCLNLPPVPNYSHARHRRLPDFGGAPRREIESFRRFTSACGALLHKDPYTERPHLRNNPKCPPEKGGAERAEGGTRRGDSRRIGGRTGNWSSQLLGY